jgi:glycine/D-amino acid oxidase-like deaminating enzyme
MDSQPNPLQEILPREALKDNYDVAIIGGATSGAAISFFLSTNPDFKGSVLVVERDTTLTSSATRASNNCMRQQFATPINIKIAQYAAEFVKNFKSIVGPTAPDLAINNFGYLYLANNEQFAHVLKKDQKVQASLGAGSQILANQALAERYPFLAIDDILLGCLNTQDEGEFDAWTIFQHLRHAAISNGVEYIENEVISISIHDSTVQSITLKTGQKIKVNKLINAAGTRAAAVSQLAGIRLPLEARQRYTYIFRGETPLLPHHHRALPLTIDPSGVHFRQLGPNAYLAGASPSGPEVGVDANDFAWRGDVWPEKIEPVIERRLPSIGKPTVIEKWVGHYDFNYFDHNAFVGPHSVIKNFLFCCGFSGHGSQQAPACGRGVSELIAYGKFVTLDLSPLSFDRIDRNEPLLERAVI